MNGKQLVKDVVVANVNLEGMASSLIDGVVEVAIMKAVEKTKTPLDNMAVQALWPKVEEEIKELVAKKIAELKASLEG